MQATWYLIECQQRDVNDIVGKLHRMHLPVQSKGGYYYRNGVRVDWRVWTCSADPRLDTMITLLFQDGTTLLKSTTDINRVRMDLGADRGRMSKMYIQVTRRKRQKV